MTSKAKRSLFRSFLNTNSLISPTWSLINAGVTDASINYNPKKTQETYIHEDTGSSSLDAIAPTLPIESTQVKADPVFAYLDTKRKARSVFASAETELVNVWLYKGAVGGLYLAEKWGVAVMVNSVGREGGKPAKLSYTLGMIGDHVIGTFDPVNLAFAEADETARLSSLVLGGSLILTPQFKRNRIWYKTSTEDATNTITAVAEDGGATIAIDVDGVTVTNGNPATWAAGLNHVVITVTNGADVAKYYIFVTAS